MSEVIEKKCRICKFCNIKGDGTFACRAPGNEEDDLLEDIVDEPHNCWVFEVDED